MLLYFWIFNMFMYVEVKQIALERGGCSILNAVSTLVVSFPRFICKRLTSWLCSCMIVKISECVQIYYVHSINMNLRYPYSSSNISGTKHRTTMFCRAKLVYILTFYKFYFKLFSQNSIFDEIFPQNHFASLTLRLKVGGGFTESNSSFTEHFLVSFNVLEVFNF